MDTVSSIRSMRGHALNVGLDIITDIQRVLIFVDSKDMVILVTYLINDDNSLSFEHQLYGEKIEDLPAHIADLSTFKRVLEFIGDQVKTSLNVTKPRLCGVTDEAL